MKCSEVSKRYSVSKVHFLRILGLPFCDRSEKLTCTAKVNQQSTSKVKIFNRSVCAMSKPF